MLLIGEKESLKACTEHVRWVYCVTIKFGPKTHVSACESNSLNAEVNGLG